ncbi:hypothetical protein JCM24511_06667 [Saitozyma sp. JCM 24511]|nr:hypothetical protein JCM24511_06667 [Saitozyma sp. JCM 24511]
MSITTFEVPSASVIPPRWASGLPELPLALVAGDAKMSENEIGAKVEAETVSMPGMSGTPETSWTPTVTKFGGCPASAEKSGACGRPHSFLLNSETSGKACCRWMWMCVNARPDLAEICRFRTTSSSPPGARSMTDDFSASFIISVISRSTSTRRRRLSSSSSADGRPGGPHARICSTL